MRSYEVGETYYFREIGRKVPRGTIIELRQGDAEKYMWSHPGLLKEVRQLAVASPKVVRAVEEKPAEKPEAEKVAAEVSAEQVETQAEDEKVEEPKKRGRAKK